MKLSDFQTVEVLVDLRAQLIRQRDNGRLAIEIDAARMNPDFVKAIEPAIRLELRHRIDDVESRLVGFGVILDG